MRTTLFLFATMLCLLACNSQTSKNLTTDNTSGETFGAAFDVKKVTAVNALIKDLSKVDSMPAQVTGTIANVCQKKGCWMNISDETGASVFVRFKDYGFFMPLDCSGKKVIMDGYAYREVTSVDELRHYAEDEGKSADEIASITEPQEEYKFLASGVILLEK